MGKTTKEKPARLEAKGVAPSKTQVQKPKLGHPRTLLGKLKRSNVEG